MFLRARAPLRISLQVAPLTDVGPPQAEEHGGVVLNATIRRE